MKIGELAKKVQVGTQTIRFYERKGLLPQPSRQGSGNYRFYREKDCDRLQFILKAKAAGFSLKDIRELADAAVSDKACKEVAELVAARLQDVQTKLKERDQLRRHLEVMLRKCTANPDKEQCPVIDGFATTDTPKNAASES